MKGQTAWPKGLILTGFSRLSHYFSFTFLPDLHRLFRFFADELGTVKNA